MTTFMFAINTQRLKLLNAKVFYYRKYMTLLHSAFTVSIHVAPRLNKNSCLLITTVILMSYMLINFFVNAQAVSGQHVCTP
jgi:hypothetical protein